MKNIQALISSKARKKVLGKIQVLILAAGKGTRLNAKNIPKVLYPISDKPILSYCLENLQKTGFKKPIVVIGFKGNLIEEKFGDRATYVWQKKQLGTGHAVMVAKKSLKDYENVLILLGDMPFWKPETLQKIIDLHQKSGATLSLISVIFEDPMFLQYGRIVRDKNNHLVKILEQKEATEKEKKIKECNPSCYVVRTDWLFKNLPKISAKGGSASGGKKSSGEYYLTDILELAISQKEKISILPIKDWQQAIGINTKEHLDLAEKLLKSK